MVYIFFKRKNHRLVDYGLKASIHNNDNDLWITGRKAVSINVEEPDKPQFIPGPFIKTEILLGKTQLCFY